VSRNFNVSFLAYNVMIPIWQRQLLRSLNGLGTAKVNEAKCISLLHKWMLRSSAGS